MQNGLMISPAASFAVPRFYEYLLVVHPAEEVFEQLKQEKEKFSATYDVGTAKKTLPHITIANFLGKEAMEEIIIKWMHKIISSHQNFDVMLNNFSGFPSSKTVYVRVQDHEPFKELASSLKVIANYVRDNGLPRAFISGYPHLTIARSLQQSVFEKAVLDYSRKTFNASFIVDELVLLKRQSQFDKCQQISVFKLSERNLTN